MVDEDPEDDPEEDGDEEEMEEDSNKESRVFIPPPAIRDPAPRPSFHGPTLPWTEDMGNRLRNRVNAPRTTWSDAFTTSITED